MTYYRTEYSSDVHRGGGGKCPAYSKKRNVYRLRDANLHEGDGGATASPESM
jgi:hypothetical protein